MNATAHPTAQARGDVATVPGLELEPGEFLVAVEKPGGELWLYVILFGIFIVTIPLALRFWGLAGRQYVVTNKRCVRIERNGSVKSIPHADLAEFKLARSLPVILGGKYDGIKLIPAPNSGHKPVMFGVLGRIGKGFTRMWGVLAFWVKGQANIEDAPAVDAAGQLQGLEPAYGALIVPKAEVGLTGAQSGVAVLTAQHIWWLRESVDVESGTIYACVPATSYVVSLATRAGSAADLEARLQESVEGGIIEEMLRFEVAAMKDASLKSGILIFRDMNDNNSRTFLHLPKAHVPKVREFLRAAGVSV